MSFAVYLAVNNSIKLCYLILLRSNEIQRKSRKSRVNFRKEFQLQKKLTSGQGQDKGAGIF
jgi:hypothetical protein